MPKKQLRFHILLPLSGKKTPDFKSSWLFSRVIKQNKITLGMAKSWPRALNRGGR